MVKYTPRLTRSQAREQQKTLPRVSTYDTHVLLLRERAKNKRKQKNKLPKYFVCHKSIMPRNISPLSLRCAYIMMKSDPICKNILNELESFKPQKLYFFALESTTVLHPSHYFVTHTDLIILAHALIAECNNYNDKLIEKSNITRITQTGTYISGNLDIYKHFSKTIEDFCHDDKYKTIYIGTYYNPCVYKITKGYVPDHLFLL